MNEVLGFSTPASLYDIPLAVFFLSPHPPACACVDGFSQSEKMSIFS